MTPSVRDRAVRYRAARTLIFQQADQGLEGYNFLTRQGFVCDVDLLTLLAQTKDWQTADQLAMITAGLSPEHLSALTEISALVAEDSPQAARENHYLDRWRWGVPTALMHFSSDGIEFLPPEESERLQRTKAEQDPSPGLWLGNDEFADRIVLPAFAVRSDLAEAMLARRTQRDAAGIVTLEELSDCLSAGMRITGQTQNCVGSLPLSMTPSGGARNPYEAYVFVRQVEGLDGGLYHYSGADHSLGKVDGAPVALDELVGGQEWARKMSAVIMLVAHLRRPMWKYEDGNAYRVMLIEAGHIAQNIALAATSHGLTACPTAAISHDLVRKKIGLCDLFEAPIYALALARP